MMHAGSVSVKQENIKCHRDFSGVAGAFDMSCVLLKTLGNHLKVAGLSLGDICCVLKETVSSD